MYGIGIFNLKQQIQDTQNTVNDIALSETVADVSNTFTCNINNSVAKNFKIAIADVNAKTISLTNVPMETSITMEITATANASITWPWADADWNEGTAPTISSSNLYEVLAYTRDKGTNWFAAITDGWDIS